MPTPTRIVTDCGQKGIATDPLPPGLLMATARINRFNAEHGVLDYIGDPEQQPRLGDRVLFEPTNIAGTFRLYRHLTALNGVGTTTDWEIQGRDRHD